MKRLYYVINDTICENFGYNKYITREHNVFDVVPFDLSLAKHSDFVISADSSEVRYLKNRYYNSTQPDPDEFMFIVLSSTEEVYR
jgi:hypothetical protein